LEDIVERTLVLVKPDGVQRGLIGEITSRLEKRGLKLVAAKLLRVNMNLAETHYAVHKGKPFYDGLVSYICSSPILAMVWEGPNVILAVRQTMGATDPTVAAPGSIRHDLALSISRNLTHASDSLTNAETEISIWFKPEEIFEWDRSIDPWLVGKN
jgi:nucleoside-diphosphate kinase